MSKLEQLINELCPEGVEYRRLENCCEILDNKRKPVTKSAREAGKYPYFGAMVFKIMYLIIYLMALLFSSARMVAL